jgi:CHAT domain-containing protein
MVSSDHYRVIVVTPKVTVAREFTITDTELNQKVAAFAQALRNRSSDPKPLAHELYTILMGTVQADLDQANAETLVWSLDGVLRYVPMAALYDGKQYAVEKYNTVTVTPASIVHLEAKPDVSNLSVAAMGITGKYEELPALPAVASELDNVAKDAKVQGANGALPGTILLDGQFTEKAMEDQLSASHGVVHIASHFVFKPGDDDTESYLLLAGKDQGGTGFHLTVAEFRDNDNLTLRHTDLLTLSACETGMSGSASNGREVDGLGMTAQLKGAKAVISTLWPVNDASTGKLMGDFYRRWAEGGGKVSKVEALRKAQLDLLLGSAIEKGGGTGRGSAVEDAPSGAPSGYAHPYYWAPFVLTGNWR